MQNTIFVGILISLLSGCGLLETGPMQITTSDTDSSSNRVAGEAKYRIEAPDFKAGQKWTYRRVDLWKNRETERFRQDFIVPDNKLWVVRWNILNSDNQQRMGSVTGELFDTTFHSFADASFSGQYQPLSFPLSNGKTWHFKYSIPSKQLSVTQTATVEGWETVKVPAGTFGAMRVNHEGNYSARTNDWSWTGRISETYWYSPEAQRIVKREYQDTNGEGQIWDQWRDELVEIKL